MNKKCKVFAHRGYSAKYPENTMLAFQKAYEAGCRGIELDVQRTLDGVLVILHDESIKRTCSHTGLVKEYTYEQLCDFDFSYKFPQFGFQKIPTLQEYVEWAKDLDLITNMELKTSIVRYEGIEEEVFQMLCAYDMVSKVIISSFNHESIVKMKSLCPTIECAFLTDCVLLNAGAYCARYGIEGYHPRFQTLSVEAMKELKEHDIVVRPWTVNKKVDKAWVLDLGVDALISNEVI